MRKNSFSSEFLEMATFLARNVSVKQPFLSQCQVCMHRISHNSLGSNSPHDCKSSLSFSLFLSRSASKAKIMSH